MGLDLEERRRFNARCDPSRPLAADDDRYVALDAARVAPIASQLGDWRLGARVDAFEAALTAEPPSPPPNPGSG